MGYLFIKIRNLSPKKLVKIGKASTPWDLANKVLYEFCEVYPGHKTSDEIVSKIWIIGRTYSAAIERRKPKDNLMGDAFYLDRVSPIILRADLDEHFKILKSGTPSMEDVLSIHNFLTQLFKKISDKHNRSLASKYLHFHFPEDVFIFDSRAKKGLAKLLGGPTGVKDKFNNSDPEYSKFFQRCCLLQGYLFDETRERLNPREIDRILLHVADN